MSVDGGPHQELQTVSTGRTVWSAPPSDADSAATSNYALISTDYRRLKQRPNALTPYNYDCS